MRKPEYAGRFWDVCLELELLKLKFFLIKKESIVKLSVDGGFLRAIMGRVKKYSVLKKKTGTIWKQ